MVHVHKAWYYHGTMYKKHDFTMVNVQKKHGIIIVHVKTKYYKGAVQRRYGFTKVNVQKAWFNHGTCKSTCLQWYNGNLTWYFCLVSRQNIKTFLNKEGFYRDKKKKSQN